MIQAVLHRNPQVILMLVRIQRHNIRALDLHLKREFADLQLLRAANEDRMAITRTNEAAQRADPQACFFKYLSPYAVQDAVVGNVYGSTGDLPEVGHRVVSCSLHDQEPILAVED